MVLGASIAFVALVFFLTVADAVKHGPSLRTIVSIPVIVLLGVGVIGALLDPPER